MTKELHELSMCPPEGCRVAPKGDNVLEWIAVVQGPEETVYAGGTFFVEISLSKQYPFEPPKAVQMTVSKMLGCCR